MRWLRNPARVLALVLPVAPLGLGLTALWLLDVSHPLAPPPVVEVEAAPRTRLLVVMVDALERREVAPRSMPLLSARLARALHGPVRACVDGITIPCVAAMITGFDRASPFSTLRNFGTARALAERSVLGALIERGVRVGYFGERLLGAALAGLTRVEIHQHGDPARGDASALAAARAALDAGTLEVAFVHLLSVDEAAHKFTARSPELQAALRRVDGALEVALARAGPADHVAVVGDHGHSASGRHGAGVGVGTYAAYFGPRVPPGERMLAITDHARIWARIFGLRWGAPGWVDGHFERRPVPAGPSELAVRPRDPAPLVLVLLLALGLAVAQADLAPHRPSFWPRSRVGAVALGGFLMLGASLALPASWAALASPLGGLALGLTLGVLGGLTLQAWKLGPTLHADGSVRVPRALALALAGALLWAPATVAPSAGFKAPLTWLLLVLAYLLARDLAARELAACGRTLGLLVLVGSFYPVEVLDYLPQHSRAYAQATAALGLAPPIALYVAAIAAVGGARGALLGALGCAAAGLLARGPDLWFMAPCAAAFPLAFAATVRRTLFAAAVLVAPSAAWFFFQRDAAALAQLAGICLVWAILPARLARTAPLLRGAALTLLIWLSLWTSMRTRIGGVDFDFYFHWLPHDAPATSEAVRQGLLTAAKCLLPVLFGALLAHERGGLSLETVRTSEHLTRVRLALTLLFAVGTSLGRGTSDVHLLHDVTQEVGFWMLTFAALGLVSLARTLAQPRCAPAREPARLPGLSGGCEAER